MNDSRPRILAILPGFIPSTIISIVKPLLRLHRVGRITAEITLESLVSRRAIKSADLVVFCRNTEPRYSYIVDLLLARGIPFVYDLDDNLFELPLDSELGRFHRSPERLAMLTHYLTSADLVRVYSEPLLKRALSLNPRTERTFGPVDWSLVSASTKKTGKVKIIYATSHIYDDLAEIFTPALSRILKEYGSRVEAHFWGIKPTSLSGFRNVRFQPFVFNYDKFLRCFSKAGFDIGLAPLKDDVFYRSKTNNKFREYGACGIAGIYSEVDVYSSCVTDAETGLLVSNDPEAWYGAIIRLLEDPDLREQIKAQAQEYVRQHYSQEKFEDIWWQQIRKLVTVRYSSPTSTPPVDAISQWQGTKIGRIVSHQDQKKESTHNFIRGKVQKMFRHLQKYGFHLTFVIFRRYLYDYWMVMKLRLLTSSADNTFKH